MKTTGPKPAKGSTAASVLMVLIIAAGCAGAETPTSVPTQILIPSTATPTPAPVTPTFTPQPLPGPEDVMGTAPAGAALTLTPSVEPDLLQRVIDNLLKITGSESDQVQLVLLEPAIWTDLDLGCGDSLSSPSNAGIQGFQIVFAVDNDLYVYHTDSSSKFRRCPQESLSANARLQIDPVAAEMVALAQRRLAQDRDLPTRRIRLVEVLPTIWTDSSLNCPLPGQTYLPVSIIGYRIVLQVGDVEYLFHTDTERVVPCDLNREQMPQRPEATEGAG